MKTNTLKTYSTILGVLVAVILVYFTVVLVKNQCAKSSIFSESADEFLNSFKGYEKNSSKPHLHKIIQVYRRISHARISERSRESITPVDNGEDLNPV